MNPRRAVTAALLATLAVPTTADDFQRTVEAKVASLLPQGALLAGRDGISHLQRLEADPPRYPFQALRTHADGKVALLIAVKSDGAVGDIRVIECDPAGLGFEEASVRAARRWTFEPAILHGRAVDAFDVSYVRFTRAQGREELSRLERLKKLTQSVADSLAAQAVPLAGRDGVTPPTRLGGPRPAYPPKALLRGVESEVILLVRLGADGIVRDVPFTYAERGDHPFLDNALAALRDWRYEPARRDGAAVEAAFWVTIEYRKRRVSAFETFGDELP